MDSGETFGDRFGQSFKILFENYKLWLSISGIYISIYVITLFLSKILINKFVINDMNNFFSNETNLYIIGIFQLAYLILIIVNVGIYLGLVKTISDLYSGKAVKLGSNIGYGFNNIINSFATYYHIFMYVYFIPSILLILGLGLILIDLINNKIGINKITSGYLSGVTLPDFTHVEWFFYGSGLTFLGIFLGIYFMIYRGVKSSFAIFMAVDKHNFSPESFKASINITKNKWWRIMGNFLVFFIVINIITSILNGIFSVFNGHIYNSGMEDITKLKSFDPIVIKSFILSLFNIDIGGLLQSALGGIQTFLGVIFIFLLYKRLEKEDGSQIWIDNGSQDILKQDYVSLSTEGL